MVLVAGGRSWCRYWLVCLWLGPWPDSSRNPVDCAAKFLVGSAGDIGSEAVVLGPGDIREAHRTGEFVPIDELERCSDVLSRAILELCG